MQHSGKSFGSLSPRLFLLASLLAAVLVGWSVGCSPVEVECNDSKPCPTGKTCNAENKCVDAASEATAEPTADASGEESSTTTETTPEAKPEDGPEAPPEPRKPTVYKWTKSNASTGKNLYGAAMPSETHAWVVGDSGTILHSSDGGNTWKAQKSGVTVGLYAVHFVDNKLGFASGDTGIILRTKDGGETWEQSKSPSKERIRKIQFVNKDIGFAVGEKFTFLATRDNGDTWQVRSSLKDINLNSLSFLDRSKGYLVGATGFIAVTVDGGLNITTAVTGTNSEIWDVKYVGEVDGYAVGTGGLLRYTDNRGASWEGIKIKTTENLYGVEFVGKKLGWVVGAKGVMFKTLDAGKLWLSISPGNLPDLHDITAFSEKAGVIVGKNGTILTLMPQEADCVDGDTQPCYSGPKGTENVGVCKEGTQACMNNEWGECKGEVLPASREICFNNEDDNCNGKDDEADGCAPCQDNETRDCFTGPKDKLGTGVCRSGKETCKSGKWGKCENQVLPTKEDCNGEDDDCDGKVDNDMKPEDAPFCDNPYGICGKSRKICVKGKWAACTSKEYGATYEKTETKCDGIDNDCDSAIDEGCSCPKDGETKTCYNGPKGTNGKGTCKEGAQTCTSGKWTSCENQVKPVKEVCGDTKDNDCDGLVDEKNQYALSFSSSRRNNVNVKANSALEPTTALTLEGYFYLFSTNARSGRALVSKSENGGYTLYQDSPKRGELGFRVWEKGAKAYTWVSASYSKKIVRNKWYHIAATYDGTTLTLWLDGKKFASKAVKGPIDYTVKNIPFIIGAEANSRGASGQYFSGRIAQVHFASKALYDKEFTPPCVITKGPDTIALWNMDEGKGDVVSDEMGKHDGKRNGATWSEQNRCKGYASGGCETKAP